MVPRAATLAISIAVVSAASLGVAATASSPGSGDKALTAAVGSRVRSPQNVARDVYRHPQQSLSFWGLKPGVAILEIWPGGGYWTEILAPYAKATDGSYRAAFVRIGSPSGKVLASFGLRRHNNHGVQRKITAACTAGFRFLCAALPQPARLDEHAWRTRKGHARLLRSA